MASFATLPSDDRWALAAYVLSLGPQPVPKGFSGRFRQDRNQSERAKAAERPLKRQFRSKSRCRRWRSLMPLLHRQRAQLRSANRRAVSSIGNNCASCHGDHGQGGIKVRTMALAPSPAYVETMPFKARKRCGFQRELLSAKSSMNGIRATSCRTSDSSVAPNCKSCTITFAA